MTHDDQIRRAVAQARECLPNLSSDYAERAIAAGKSVGDVKADLVDLMSANPRERGLANMRAQVERQGLTRGGSGTPPTSSGGTANGKALMADMLRRQGIEPLTR